MAALIVLLVSWFIFRLLGALTVPIFLSWHDCLRYALAVMFLFTSAAHFNRLRHDLARMIPVFVPAPMALVYLTGALELAGAIGLMLPHHIHRLTAWCLIAFLIAVFPANVYAALAGATLGGKPVTRLWLRTPMQLLFIALLYWSAHK